MVHIMTDTLPMRAIAENLQKLRKGQEMSLAVLARKAGIGKSTIFNLERAQGNPAIDTLWSLARALDVPIGALFIDTALSDVRVMRRDEAPVLVGEVPYPRGRDGRHHHSAEVSSQTFVSRHLLSTHQGRQCELYWIDMAAASVHASAGHTAGLIEHVVTIRGTVVISVDNEPIELSAGDRMSFPAERSHRYETADGPAAMLSLLEYVE
jgi:XRE family transcriptional regulator, regulator of sulfur utilization